MTETFVKYVVLDLVFSLGLGFSVSKIFEL